MCIKNTFVWGCFLHITRNSPPDPIQVRMCRGFSRLKAATTSTMTRNICAYTENYESFMYESLNTFVNSSVCTHSFWECSDPTDFGVNRAQVRVSPPKCENVLRIEHLFFNPSLSLNFSDLPWTLASTPLPIHIFANESGSPERLQCVILCYWPTLRSAARN